MRLIDADALEKRFEHLETVGNDLVHKVTEEEKGTRIAYHLAKYETHVAPTIVDTGSLRPQWIPVAERLPEENVSVLATVSGMPSTNVTLYKTVVIAEYFGNEGWYVEEWPDWEDASPDYWMPLPDPYEPEDVEQENET